MKEKYFCSICKVSFRDSKSFILDRQNHITQGKTKKQHGKSKTTTN